MSGEGRLKFKSYFKIIEKTAEPIWIIEDLMEKIPGLSLSERLCPKHSRQVPKITRYLRLRKNEEIVVF